MHKKILVSLCGYVTDLVKTAVCITTSNTFTLVDENSKKTVFSGSLSKSVFSEEIGEYVKIADFSSFSVNGTYYVKCGFRRSDPFVISSDAYSSLSSLLLSGIFLNRCGYDYLSGNQDDSSERTIYFRNACHNEMVPMFFGDNKLDAAGGWHCGEGYGKSVAETALTCALMLYTLKIFPDAYDEKFRGELTDECRWGIEWLLKMQTPDGGVYHKCDTSKRTAFPSDPANDSNDYYVFPKSYKDALLFTAVTALAAGVYEKTDIRFSRQLSRAATNGWLWIVNCPDYEPWAMPSGSSETCISDIPDRDSTDDYMWVLAEMYSLTGDDLFERRFLRLLYETDSSGFSLNRTGGFASLSYLMECGERDAAALFFIKKKFGDRADSIISECSMNVSSSSADIFPERSRFGEYSNLCILSDSITCMIAYMIFGMEKYLNAAVLLFQFVLGKNPCGYSFITGSAESSPKRPRHSLSSGDDIDPPVPGMVVNGSNYFNKDPYSAWLLKKSTPPAGCYIDSEFSESNQPSVCIGAAAIMISSFLNKCGSSVFDEYINK